MQNHPSAYSLAACGLYAGVAALCWLTAGRDRRRDSHAGSQRFWVLMASFFGLLIAARLLAIEDLVRQLLREHLADAGGYSERWAWQAPMTAALLVLAAIGFGRIWKSWRSAAENRSAQWLLLGRLAALTMMALVALRLISFHATDQLLYAGPHLNWVIDIGASLLAGLAAWKFRNDQLTP